MKKDIADLPCYTNPNIQDDFRKKILIKSKWLAYAYDSMSEDREEEDANWIKILAPLTDNLNVYVQDNFREKMYKTCKKGRGLTNVDTEIIKILAPLTDNPNKPNENGQTLIHFAAWNGHTEIVKILAHLTDHPNAPDEKGQTPIMRQH